jgi:hypothetical protein
MQISEHDVDHAQALRGSRAMPRPIDDVGARLAAAFADGVIEAVTAGELAEIRKRNAAEKGNDLYCASHDFMDANMVMLAAFQEVVLRDPRWPSDAAEGRCTEAESDADFALIESAWTRARAAYLTAHGASQAKRGRR